MSNYTCSMPGCPGGHSSKWSVCSHNEAERIDNLVAVIEKQDAEVSRLRGELEAAEQHVKILQEQRDSPPHHGASNQQVEQYLALLRDQTVNPSAIFEVAPSIADEMEQLLRQRDYFIAAHDRACQEYRELNAKYAQDMRATHPETSGDAAADLRRYIVQQLGFLNDDDNCPAERFVRLARDAAQSWESYVAAQERKGEPVETSGDAQKVWEAFLAGPRASVHSDQIMYNDYLSSWMRKALEFGLKYRAPETSCECVICTCADPDQCHGCGARYCSLHDPRSAQKAAREPLSAGFMECSAEKTSVNAPQWRGFCECTWDETRSLVVTPHATCRFHGSNKTTDDPHGDLPVETV